jgi:hypothetical protein
MNINLPTTPFIVKDGPEFIEEPNGELSAIHAYKIKTRDGETLQTIDAVEEVKQANLRDRLHRGFAYIRQTYQ